LFPRRPAFTPLNAPANPAVLKTAKTKKLLKSPRFASRPARENRPALWDTRGLFPPRLTVFTSPFLDANGNPLHLETSERSGCLTDDTLRIIA
jgi:hypothetical protein